MCFTSYYLIFKGSVVFQSSSLVVSSFWVKGYTVTHNGNYSRLVSMSSKKRVKSILVALQHKLLSQDSIRRRLLEQVNQAATPIPDLKNCTTPYDLCEYPEKESAYSDLVIVTGRFRSGSTFLWNIFRQAGQFTAYYEPFNERRWFDEKTRGAGVDSSHRGVDDYWAEYNGLQDLSAYYDEDWIRHCLLMGRQDYNPNMRSYIEALATKAPQRPLLQFNRIDFRLAWIKANFPTAKLLHLYRHPRDQWCSFLTDHKLMNKDEVVVNYIDAFYLDVWCDDLLAHFPFLDSHKTPHPYQRFYYLWKLSYLFGRRYSDYSFSFEDLTTKPDLVLREMFDVLGVSNLPIAKLCDLVQAPKPDKWRDYAHSDWFEPLERECEQVLSAFFSSELHVKEML